MGDVFTAVAFFSALVAGTVKARSQGASWSSSVGLSFLLALVIAALFKFLLF